MKQGKMKRVARYCSVLMVIFVLNLLAGYADVKARDKAQRIHPIVAVHLNLLVGGTLDGRWVTADTIARSLKGRERYRLYSMVHYLGESQGTRPTVEGPGDYQYVEIRSGVTAQGDIIAVGGIWNALPRTPKTQSTRQKVYLDAVRSILRQMGLINVPVNLTQVIRIDLEGDKQEEILVSATTPRARYPDSTIRRGDYSFVMLRKVIRGKVETFILDGEFYTKPVDFAAPNKYRVMAVLDLNGDGVMEILVGSDYYEGEGVGVFAVKERQIKKVLMVGIGA